MDIHYYYYENKFEDYNDDNGQQIIDTANATFSDTFKESLREEAAKLINMLDENKQKWEDTNDYSKAKKLLQKCIDKISGKVTFLSGNGGSLTLLAVLLTLDDPEEDNTKLINQLKDSLTDNTKVEVTSNELLYGHAGYLAALLYINSKISPPPIDANSIKEVIARIITSGRKYATKYQCRSPLMYSWHDKEYIGAAHGLAGILYMLLQARDYISSEEMDTYIKPSISYLQGLQFPSGNFPSSMGRNSDRLVQWCHGAPGLVSLFCLAYKVFEDDTFLDSAVRCGQIIWEKGLLKKGYSLCHGVAGNAYAFLCLFQYTKDVRYLYQASKFAEWCFKYGVHQERVPDRPFSLFEGVAGVIYFLNDIQKPNLARFPTYDI